MTELTPQMALELFQRGVTEAKAGRKSVARQLIRQAVSIDPGHEAAWLYLAGMSETRAEALEAVERVGRLNPANPHLAEAKTWIAQRWPDQEITPDPTPTLTAPPAHQSAKFSTKVIGGVLVAGLAAIIVFGLLIFGVPEKVTANFIAGIAATPTQTLAQELILLNDQFKAAQHEANQPAMIAALEKIHAQLPDDTKIAAQLARQYFDQGLVLKDKGDFEAAQEAFERALNVEPTFKAAQKERELATLYLAGVEHHQAARWSEAVTVFETLYRQEPDYPAVAEILFSSLYNLGLVQQNQGKLEEAIQTFERADQVLPYTPEVEKKVVELVRALTPPTPVPTPTPRPGPQKRVVVDISEQRAYVYKGDNLVYQFIVSTGEPGRDTAVGRFEILNKIPVAYASTWNLDMPYWLGIYWSGSLQNGFHALPTVRHTGYTLWDGFLGQRVSYGCIILSYADAQTLYDWVDIGTPVTIQY